MKKALLLSSLTVLVLTGCSKPTLVGSWNLTGGNFTQNGATTVADFSGNTVKVKISVAQQGISLGIDATGTYTLEGNEFKATISDLTVDDSQVPPMVKTFIKSKLDPAMLKKTIAEDLAGTVTFVDGDKVTVVGKKSSEITMTRVKPDAATKKGA